MTRKQKITLGASVSGLGIAYLIYNSISRKNLFNKIYSAIGGNEINISLYNEWFNPNYYTQFSDGYIFLTSSNVLSKARKLGDAFESWGNNSDEILGVFRAIPDGVALSQIAEKFEAKGYGDLRTKVGDLNKDELSQVGQILSQKQPFRKSS